MAEIKFAVFADFHYKKGMYPASIADLEAIFARAKDNHAEFVVHLGDMCNDYRRSPELVHAYLENRQDFEVYGIYGNHELESAGNTMEFVTPLLSNQPQRVVWGSNSGTLGDGSIGYYYLDKKDFRFVFLDTNYSRPKDLAEYEHNKEASWGAPAENMLHDSLGKTQLSWLKKVLFDAASEGKKCIILSHASFCPAWESSPDSEAVRGIFQEVNSYVKGTVLLALNGHYHNNRQATIDDVVYIDVNTVRNGYWQSERFYAYAERDDKNPQYTFEYTDYDEKGEPMGSCLRAFSSLRMGDRSLFFKDALSAVISVDTEGGIKVEGMTTEWAYGIAPKELPLTPELLSISSLKK
ncbi:MAG: metallophosphoesterase [Clostridia bacterium]|nr:metallophosphoesterase [Clostridia bacterium]